MRANYDLSTLDIFVFGSLTYPEIEMLLNFGMNLEEYAKMSPMILMLCSGG